MSDFVSDSWHYYVAGLVVLSLIFCAWILISNMTRRKPGPVELQDHVWDETLQEYNNPLPRWWLYLFWLTLAFAVAYFVLYPGLGRWQGKLGWSSSGQYKAEVATVNEQIGPIYRKFLSQDVRAVSLDPEARAMGQRLFLTYCTQCHGSDAGGNKGFPNLTDSDWLHGGEPENIRTTIENGRIGVMAPFGEALGSENVKDVANYVRSLSGLAHDALRAQRGRQVFADNCVACHGPEGKGNQTVGAPNLTDRTWLWGSTEATIIETVTYGRVNQMPSFKTLLGDEKIHLLTAYVLSLSAGKDAQTR
ncbi:MAG: cytochrome-c oxidase, cbb3-type subunit III [Candidatus Dactylopiibacterium carminicum]|nr:MAG: cytochrome-c oxidase, cbb3-type subunit III [Candidatus Dactylopiibacterium carminicum]